MARFIFFLSAVAVTLSLTSTIHAAPKENLVGKVFFLEEGQEEYLQKRVPEVNVEDEVMSGSDTAAAIAVLLGVPPPPTLSTASSARLDSLLSPNPFKRPHAVVALTIRGVMSESQVVHDMEKIFGSYSVQQRKLSAHGFQRPTELPGQDVVIHSLKYVEHGYDIETSLRSLASFLEGSWSQETEGEIMRLRIGDISISFDLGTKDSGDLKFVQELLSLFHSVQSLSTRQGDKSQAKLFLGTFSTLELMEEGSEHRKDATILLLQTAVWAVRTLGANDNAPMVGVFSLLGSRPVPPMFVSEESRSARYLLDDALLAPSPSQSYANQSLYDVDIRKLQSRSIVTAVVLILLVASGLGSFFLVYMPLTRDTLLYANVKLD